MAEGSHGTVSVENETNIDTNTSVKEDPPRHSCLSGFDGSGTPNVIDGGDLIK